MLFAHTKRLFALEHEIESYIDVYRNGKQGKLRIDYKKYLFKWINFLNV
jgi:hypothetical protein